MDARDDLWASIPLSKSAMQEWEPGWRDDYYPVPTIPYDVFPWYGLTTKGEVVCESCMNDDDYGFHDSEYAGEPGTHPDRAIERLVRLDAVDEEGEGIGPVPVCDYCDRSID